MPVRPPLFRPRTGRGSLPDRAAATRAYDRRRFADSETRRLYKLKRWQDIRTAQLLASPVCEDCARLGETVAATVCDHVDPHGGDPERFWRGPFQSLCKRCHDSAKQREENALRKGASALRASRSEQPG